MAEKNIASMVLVNGDVSETYDDSDNDQIRLNDRPQVRPNVESLLDFEQEVNAVKGYVTDYFKYRLSLSGCIWPDCPEIPEGNEYAYELMRSVVLTFEDENAGELRAMIALICFDEDLSFSRYAEIVERFALDEDETEAEMSYGRLIALLAFGGLLVTHYAQINMSQEITPVVIFTTKFIEHRIYSTWAQYERSWSAFFKVAESLVRNKENQRKERPLGFLCWAGAFALVALGSILVGRGLLQR